MSAILHQLPDIATLRKEFNRFAKGVRNTTESTLAAYNHDLDTYLEYLVSDPKKSSNFEINEHRLRNFVIFLRERGNVNSTIQRRLDGVSAFWKFIHLEYNYSEPRSAKDCGIRLKNKRNPTPSIPRNEYKIFMETIYDELRSIN